MRSEILILNNNEPRCIMVRPSLLIWTKAKTIKCFLIQQFPASFDLYLILPTCYWKATTFVWQITTNKLSKKSVYKNYTVNLYKQKYYSMFKTLIVLKISSDKCQSCIHAVTTSLGSPMTIRYIYTNTLTTHPVF